MSQTKNSHKKIARLLYGSVIAIWCLNLALSFMHKNTLFKALYKDVSDLRLKSILVGFSVPTLLIWLSLAFAFMGFYSYSKKIKGSKEETAFRYISYALGIALASSIITSLFGQLRTFSSEAAVPLMSPRSFTIVSNYLAVTTAVLIYWFYFRSSRVLLSLAKKTIEFKNLLLVVILPTLLLGGTYIYLIFHNTSRFVSNSARITATYGLSDNLIVSTVALPYIISWGLAILALVGIYIFQSKTSGIVYKRLFKYITAGISLIIGLSIFLQFLTQFPNYFVGKSLSALLWIIAAIFLVVCAGYLLIARGARLLNKIEEIEG